MTIDVANFEKLATQYEDAVRHALIVESTDWDTIIVPGLVEYGNIMGTAFAADPTSTLMALRVLFENVYVMGYERGKAAHDMPQFVVSTETEPNE